MSFRDRVVVYTLAVVLGVAGSFFAVHRVVTARLLRASVDEPWGELVEGLRGDPYVQGRLLGPGSGEGWREASSLARTLDPDAHILAYLVVDPAGTGGAKAVGVSVDEDAVVDRYSLAVDDADAIGAALERVALGSLARGRHADDEPETSFEGELALRVGTLSVRRPVPPDAVGPPDRLVGPASGILAVLSERVVPRLSEEAARAPAPDDGEGPSATAALEAVLELYRALGQLVSEVLVPASLASAPGSWGVDEPLPEPLEAVRTGVVRWAGLGPEPDTGPGGDLADRVDPEAVRAWAAEVRGWLERTRFEEAPPVHLVAAFRSPNLALFRSLGRTYLIVSVALALAGALIAGLVTRGATRPLARIVSGIDRFAAGDFEHRIDTGSRGELAHLTGELNAMARRIKEGERSRRLASMGLVVGGAAHELKNPVHAIERALELVARYREELAGDAVEPARRDELHSRTDRLLEGCRENADRMRQILEEISAVHRAGTDRRGPVDLAAAARDALDALRSRWEGTIEVEVDAPDEVIVHAASSVARILHNLIANAVSAVEEARAAGHPAGRVRVRLSRDGQHARLSVDDDGDGIDPGLRDRIFDLFFTTREVGRGTGLGLFLVHEVVAAHGGTVTCESPGGLGGATFAVELPVGVAGPADGAPGTGEGGNAERPGLAGPPDRPPELE